MSYYFSHNPLSPTDAGIVPLFDNLCLADIMSPRSKCNAKPQSREAQLWLVVLISWLLVLRASGAL